jgi:16S rRNA processing protein RimM
VKKTVSLSNRHYIPLGKIQAPWGLKGEVKVQPYHSSSQALMQTRRIYLKAGFSFREVALLSARPHGKSLLLHLEGMDSPERALTLRGEEIFLPEDVLPPKKKGEYYVFELVGMEVVTPEGRRLGLVKEVVRYGASEILVIADDRGKKGEEVMVPLVPDFLRGIHEEERRIVIEPMEGLF